MKVTSKLFDMSALLLALGVFGASALANAACEQVLDQYKEAAKNYGDAAVSAATCSTVDGKTKLSIVYGIGNRTLFTAVRNGGLNGSELRRLCTADGSTYSSEILSDASGDYKIKLMCDMTS
ncbi:hypothetical protein [Andreprevotia chitinilytica]|uniref:hypothetical protein n=1 Tax=Andreprevotia chitinilytica TaxID=396808 RepID=UPI000557D803|nr:hypothetical protein [Andreprevotia chitinilytica]